MKKSKVTSTDHLPPFAGIARVVGIGLAILLLAYLLASMSGMIWPNG